MCHVPGRRGTSLALSFSRCVIFVLVVSSIRSYGNEGQSKSSRDHDSRRIQGRVWMHGPPDNLQRPPSAPTSHLRHLRHQRKRRRTCISPATHSLTNLRLDSRPPSKSTVRTTSKPRSATHMASFARPSGSTASSIPKTPSTPTAHARSPTRNARAATPSSRRASTLRRRRRRQATAHRGRVPNHGSAIDATLPNCPLPPVSTAPRLA